MSDEKEYSYPEDTSVEDTYATGALSGTESWRTLLKNKRLMYSLGGIVAFYILLEIATMLFGGSDSNAPTQAMSAHPTISVPKKVELEATSKPAAVDQSAAKKVDPVPETPKVNVAMPQPQVVSQEMQTMKTQMSQLAAQQGSTAQQVTELRRTLETMGTQIDRLVKAENERAAALERAQTKKETKPVVLKHFHINAAVHGRAWLRSVESGGETTVTLGDHLPTYGQITSIDPYAGVIQTSSGRKIEYAKNDR